MLCLNSLVEDMVVKQSFEIHRKKAMIFALFRVTQLVRNENYAIILLWRIPSLS